jgi:signal transduction histidine kinase/DNA-binding NarL/FixJ family response regulator
MNVLYLEDRPLDALVLQRQLAKAASHFGLHVAANADDFRKLLSVNKYVAVICDNSVQGLDFSGVLSTVQSLELPIPVLVLTGHVDEKTAQLAFEKGVFDYISKEEIWRVGHSLTRAIRDPVETIQRNREQHSERARQSTETERLPQVKSAEQKDSGDSSSILDSMQTILDTVLKLSAARKIEDIAEIIRHAARKVVHADGATFILKKGNFCYYADEEAIGPLWKGTQFPIETCASGWAMLYNEQVVIPDIYNDERIPIDAYRPTFVKSLTITPVRTASPIAAIGTYWKNEYEASAEDRRLLQALADTTSVAIENVNLLNELEDRVAERTHQLQNVNHELESFARSVAHDLKTPLVGIGQLLELVRHDEKQPLQEPLRGHIEAVSEECGRLSLMVTDLLNLARIAHTDLVKEPVNLTEIATAASRRLKNCWPKDVVFEIAPDMQVYADPVLLNVVMENLLSNACKYSSKVECPVVKVSSSTSGPDMAMQTVTVSDNGAGFDQNHAGRIFDVFQRLHDASEFPGSGVGLATVQRIIHRHGGEISAHSTAGHGATFKFTLPKAR